MIYLIVLYHFLIASVQSGSPVAKDAMDRIHRECIPTWRERLETGKRLYGKLEGCFENSLGRSETSEVNYKKLGENRLLHYVSRSVANADAALNYEEEVWGSNTNYSFRLRKKVTDTSWVVLEVVQHSSDLVPKVFAKRYEMMDRACTRQYRFNYMSMLDTFTHPDCKLIRAEEFDRDGRTLVLVEFATTAPVFGDLKDHVKRGKVTLDPNADWVMIHGEWEEDNGRFTSKVNREYFNYYNVGGLYVPSKMDVDQSDRDNNGNSATRSIRESFTLTTSTDTLSVHDFTLSAFGFIEPHGVTWPKPPPYWLYGTLLAVLAIFIGIVLVRWSLKPKAG